MPPWRGRLLQRHHLTDLFLDRALADEKRREKVQAMVTGFDKNANGTIDPEERPALRTFIQESGMLKGL